MSPTALAAPAPTVANDCPGFITDLVLRCGTGDESALAHLFDLTSNLVSTLVSGSAGSTRIDDRIVDAFARIWQRSPSFDPTSDKALAWVLEQVVDRG